MLSMFGGTFARLQRGQAMVEYALILVLIAVVVIAALIALGGQITNVFTTITNTLGGTGG